MKYITKNDDWILKSKLSEPIVSIDNVDAFFLGTEPSEASVQLNENILQYIKESSDCLDEKKHLEENISSNQCSPLTIGSSEHSDSTNHEESSSRSINLKCKSKPIRKSYKQLVREEEHLICKSRGRKTEEE
jgi:hypothetical protein